MSGGKIKNALVGSYDYKFLCLPQWPWCRGKKGPHKGPPFFAKDEKLSLLISAVMGLQHALAMVGGIVTPPLIISYLQKDSGIANYLVAASLIVSGVCTVIHVLGFDIPRTRYMYGTGIISVIGTSFTFLNVTQQSINNMMADGDSFNEAYGRILGTQLVCCWLTVILSFMPPRALRRVFPPLVTGTTIFLIGAGLIGTGLTNWGGGAVCQEYATSGLPQQQIDCRVFDNVTNAFDRNTTCFAPAEVSLCSGNGEVALQFGSPEYIGLGAIVFLVLILLEVFGSPFMRNCEVIIALLFGYLISAVITSDGGKKYVQASQFKDSPSITFLWVKTFGFGFYAPAVLPFLIGFVLTTVEAIGDITATEEASFIATVGDKHNKRIQGGLLGDGFNSFFAGLAGSLPNTTFAQNNGVLALTRCASRRAGYACGVWLFLFGILAKVGAFFTEIPVCVLGGMTTFLFAGVCVSGLKVITMEPITRRSRFILCVALGLGLGVELVPNWATNHLWTPPASKGLLGFRNAIILVLSNGFSIGAIIAVLLHLALPFDAVDAVDAGSASMLPTTVHPSSPDDIAQQKGMFDAPPAETEMARGTLDDSAHHTVLAPKNGTIT